MKRSNAVTARELVEFFVAAKDTPKLHHPHRSGAPDVQRQATIWFMHQFDPVAIWRALQGQSPSPEDKSPENTPKTRSKAPYALDYALNMVENRVLW